MKKADLLPFKELFNSGLLPRKEAEKKDRVASPETVQMHSPTLMHAVSQYLHSWCIY